ncbi:MAG: stress response translation initiation inhibitor YciH [Nanoarchaeota archaeon]|nr:stress response translation initiation inhibitor YciH [Nanoarchaeota archaeon]MBU1051625.1 stress response translation initiation inhibitor YciH [Nanoarchaeota archaeon]MBU1988827.1 stress response translation initiation inhibitor YciH [Nanoarchaeota archaeon]
MDSDEFGLPTETDVFEEIAKSEQQIKVTTQTRRYGKKITLVEGFDKHVDIKATAKRLKEELACGGTAKNGVVELQGDHRKKVKPILVKLGFAEEVISD